MKEFKDLKIKLNLGIGFAGANQKEEVYLHEYFDEDEWNNLTPSEKDNALSEIAEEWAYEFIEYAAWVE